MLNGSVTVRFSDGINQRYFQDLCIQYEAVCQQCLGEVEDIKVIVCLFLCLCNQYYYLAIQRSIWRDIKFAFFTRHSLVERRASEVFVLLYVCLFVRSTISQQYAKFCMRA